MAQTIQIRRTPDPAKPPPNGSLDPGMLAVEMASQPMPRLWCGVPTTIDATGRRLVTDANTLGGRQISTTPPAVDQVLVWKTTPTPQWVPTTLAIIPPPAGDGVYGRSATDWVRVGTLSDLAQVGAGFLPTVGGLLYRATGDEHLLRILADVGRNAAHIAFAIGGAPPHNWLLGLRPDGNFTIANTNVLPSAPPRINFAESGATTISTIDTGLPADSFAGITVLRTVGAQTTRVMIDVAGGNGAANLMARRANGTSPASLSRLNANDVIFGLPAIGYGDNAYSGIAANLQIIATETWTNWAQGTRFVFSTTPIGGTGSVGRVSIGTGVSVGDTADPGHGNIRVTGNGISYPSLGSQTNNIGFSWIGSRVHVFVDGFDQGAITTTLTGGT